MNLPHPWTRRLASSVTTIALLAAGLVATGASLAPAARAAAAAPVLRWEISQQYDDHLSNHVLGDGATEDSAGVITFPGGVGTFDPATGVASVAYQGSVRGAFAFAGSEFYHVKLEDPIVAVTADGRGQITALVSAANVSQGSTPAEETQPLRVVLTTF
ncbi:MAG: hypothetical protein F2667_12905, partial [Actinobacteria bacterium]|nr:hypothetical protein [Actinomycetota bacterium]